MSTDRIVALHTQNLIFKLSLFTTSNKMRTFLFSTIKQFSALSTIFNMIEVYASMRTTGRTTEENHMYIIMIQSHALFGNLMIS